MIVTVTLNPALDLTYAVPALVRHRTHRVTAVLERPGGKGLNVARVLHRLGEPVLATGFLGGPTGARVAGLLRSGGVAGSFVDIAGETRRTVAVVDPADATGFSEPGPTITPDEWAGFVAHFRRLLPRADVVTLSGSLPPGLPEDAYANLVALARAAAVPTVLDTSGPALAAGLTAGPTIVKPNTDELAALLATPTRHPRTDPPDQQTTRHPRTDPPDQQTTRHPRTDPHDQQTTRHPRTDPHHEQATPYTRSDPPARPAGRHTRTGAVSDAELAASVRDLGADAVVLSRGASGVLAVTGNHAWAGLPAERVDGNPTGAGDACVAALARGLRDRDPWPELLADVLALGAAAVADPVAGSFDTGLYRRTRPRVTVTPVGPPASLAPGGNGRAATGPDTPARSHTDQRSVPCS